MVNERKTNIELSLELKEAQKEKGAKPSEKVAKAMKTQTLDPFTGNDTQGKKDEIVGPPHHKLAPSMYVCIYNTLTMCSRFNVNKMLINY